MPVEEIGHTIHNIEVEKYTLFVDLLQLMSFR